MENTVQDKADPFWFDNLSILYQQNRLIEFFPMQEQTLNEKLNSIVRLSFYCSIILSFYHENNKYFYIFITVLLLTYFIHQNNPVLNVEHLSNEFDCTKPTIENPFMNFTMTDYLNLDKRGNIIDRPPACADTPETKKRVDDAFNNNLFTDTNDIFGKKNSQRMFNTMPNTDLVNDRDSFAKWLYSPPVTCKEDPGACTVYQDLRSTRPELYDSTTNPVDTKKR